MKPYSLLAVVPARKGSKRLPNKNFKEFDQGEALYQRALNLALDIPAVNKVVFSSDCELSELDLAEGVLFDRRPDELALEDSSSQDLGQYLWQAYGEGCQALLWLQPTSPLRTKKDILEAIDLWQGSGSVVSCSKEGEKYLRSIDGQGVLRLEGNNETVSLNGAIYILDENAISDKQWVLGHRAYIMPIERSLDIDDEVDWDQALKWIRGQ